MRETQKIECRWFPFPSLFPIRFGKPPELDQTRFIRVEFQPELCQPLSEILQKAVRIHSTLKAKNTVVGIPNDDHVSLPVLLPPDFHPEIEDIMQIDIGKQR